MARMIHVASSLLHTGATPPGGAAADAMGGRVARPRSLAVLTPWFELSPFAPSVDSRVSPGVGVGVVASLQLFGVRVGSGTMLATAADPSGGSGEAALGGNPSSASAAAPASVSEFAQGCSAGLSLFAQGVSTGAQCLLLFGLRGRGPDDRADVQVFAGVKGVGAATVIGEDSLPVLLDLPPTSSSVSVEIWLRLCGAPDSACVGVRGVAGFLL